MGGSSLSQRKSIVRPSLKRDIVCLLHGHASRGEDHMANHIGRREVLCALAGAAVAWPLAARAQQPDQMRRIGVLMGYAESDLEAKSWVKEFVQGFKELGWIVGRNVSIDYRFGAGDADRMRAYAEELVGLAPAVILAHTSPVMAALQQATRT